MNNPGRSELVFMEVSIAELSHIEVMWRKKLQLLVSAHTGQLLLKILGPEKVFAMPLSLTDRKALSVPVGLSHWDP